MRLIILFLLSVLTIACQPESVKERAKVDYFFDLEAFMNQEIERLNEAQPRIEKRIVLSGKTEVKQFDSLDYERELAVFVKADINKVAWVDKYEADSSYQDGKLTKVTYTTKDKDLKTHLLEVSFEQGEVVHIHARGVTESVVADVYKDMDYWPGKGYTLSSAQSTVLSEETAVEVEAEFLE